MPDSAQLTNRVRVVAYNKLDKEKELGGVFVMPTTRRRHRKKWGDALVEVRGHRVRAAIEVGLRTTVNAAASKLGTSQQTLDYVVRGRNKRCRRSVVTRLARRAEGVTFDWLTGKADFLPGATYRGDDVLPGPGTPVSDALARSQVIESRLWRKCEDALRRDIQKSLGNSANQDDVRRELFYAFRDLLHPIRWHLLLLVQRHDGTINDTRSPVRPSEWEAIVEGLASALEAILTPWFRGRAELDYGTLRRWRYECGRALPETNPAAIIPASRSKHAQRLL